MLSTHANIFNEIELLTYHREEALEWSVNLLSIVGPNSDGRCLSQRAKVIGWLHLVLGCPWNSPDKMHDPLLKIKNHFKKINKSHQPNSFFFFLNKYGAKQGKNEETHSRLAITPPVRDEPLFPPQPTSITLVKNRNQFGNMGKSKRKIGKKHSC